MSHVFTWETGTDASRLMKLADDEDGVKTDIRRKGLPTEQDILEPLARVHEDISQLVSNLLLQKSTGNDLAKMARLASSILEEAL